MKLSRVEAAEVLDRLIARESFKDYCLRVSTDDYKQPPHVLALIDHLERLERGEIKRLIVEMPPRSSKSTHVSRLFPSFWMGRHPDDGVILASYSDRLATDNGRAVRDYISHSKYPFKTKIRKDVKAAGRWQTDDGGGLVAVGVETGLTGWPLPGKLVVIDDPVKDRAAAESELIRENTWKWWQETLLTRLDSEGVVVVLGTRWHEDDLIGRILRSPGSSEWVRLRIPYFAEEDDPVGRKAGDKLPIFGNPPSVEKGEISSYGFAALYQQNPSPAGGGVFKREWMSRRYNHADLQKAKSTPRWRVIQAVDLGGKQGVGHDPSAIATWGTDGISFYLLDYWSSQKEYADIKAIFTKIFFAQNPRMMYVEDATWAQPLISDLRRHTGIRVNAIKPQGSKWVRADAIAPQFEAGRVVLPDKAPWLDDWIHEHVSFPSAPHDEAVDTTSLALKMLSGQMSATPKPKPQELASNVRYLFSDRPTNKQTGTTVSKVM